jgi:hypothetical protein
MEKTCEIYDCWAGKDMCSAMMKMADEATAEDEAGASSVMMRCLCAKGVVGPAIKMLKASENVGAPEGTCNDATLKDDDGIDICALAKQSADGDCAALMNDGLAAIEGSAKCTDMAKLMEKDWTDEDKKCVEDIKAALAAKSEGGDTASDFARNTAFPSFGGFVVLASGLGVLWA